MTNKIFGLILYISALILIPPLCVFAAQPLPEQGALSALYDPQVPGEVQHKVAQDPMPFSALACYIPRCPKSEERRANYYYIDEKNGYERSLLEVTRLFVTKIGDEGGFPFYQLSHIDPQIEPVLKKHDISLLGLLSLMRNDRNEILKEVLENECGLDRYTVFLIEDYLFKLSRFERALYMVIENLSQHEYSNTTVTEILYRFYKRVLVNEQGIQLDFLGRGDNELPSLLATKDKKTIWYDEALYPHKSDIEKSQFSRRGEALAVLFTSLRAISNAHRVKISWRKYNYTNTYFTHTRRNPNVVSVFIPLSFINDFRTPVARCGRLIGPAVQGRQRISVLTVCTGNQNRSVLMKIIADRLLKKYAVPAEMPVSRGTLLWHPRYMRERTLEILERIIIRRINAGTQDEKQRWLDVLHNKQDVFLSFILAVAKNDPHVMRSYITKKGKLQVKCTPATVLTALLNFDRANIHAELQALGIEGVPYDEYLDMLEQCALDFQKEITDVLPVEEADAIAALVQRDQLSPALLDAPRVVKRRDLENATIVIASDKENAQLLCDLYPSFAQKVFSYPELSQSYYDQWGDHIPDPAYDEISMTDLYEGLYSDMATVFDSLFDDYKEYYRIPESRTFESA